MKDVRRLLEQLIQSGKLPPDLAEALREALNDPSALPAIMEKLTGFMGTAASDSLDMADYYHEGDGRKFEQRWPPAQGNPLIGSGLTLDAFDRKTQFSILFAEWSRREADGLDALNRGDLGGAEQVFQECLERADQIQVAELRARTCEDMARVAERRGDQSGVLHWTDEAEKARSRV
jgi:hypothetical protein